MILPGFGDHKKLIQVAGTLSESGTALGCSCVAWSLGCVIALAFV